MSRSKDPSLVEISLAIYRLLLVAYPPAFRQEYGAHMLQVFGDSCRDVTRRKGTRGLIPLWCWTIYDLLTTSLDERMAREKERYKMDGMTARKSEAMSRREFLNLAWLASLGFLLVDLGGAAYLFAKPVFREGDFGGRFVLGRAGDALPPPGGAPRNVPKGKFWLIRTGDNRLVAPYKVCPHLGCLYNWNPAAEIFLCPCHYSRYQLDGTVIGGPAPRSVDRFVVRLLDSQGVEVAATDAQGNPLPLPDEDVTVVIETGQLITGKPKGERYTA